MAAAIVGIISDYSHTFSDSDFERLFGKCEDMFALDVSHSGKVSCNCGSNKYSPIRDSPLISCIFTQMHQPSDDPRPFVMDITYDPGNNGIVLRNWRQIYSNEHIWEFLQHHFGQDNDDYLERWVAIWQMFEPPANKTKLTHEVPELFAAWCNNLLKFIGDRLYNDSHTLVCPWMPDPMFKKTRVNQICPHPNALD